MSAELDSAVESVNREFAARHPLETAAALEELPPADIGAFLATSEPGVSAPVLLGLTPDAAQETLASLDPAAAAGMLAAADRARVAALLARLPEERRELLLAELPAAAASELRTLGAYPADSAGHLMDPRVTAFRPDATAQSVLDRLETLRGRRVQNVHLVDADGMLVGAVPLQDVALAPPDERLGALAGGSPPRVRATAGREEVLEEFAARRVASLPVVDFEGRLVGVIRHAALVDAATAEATADVATMVGASAEERALSPPFFAVRKRLPWLVVNLGTAFLAAAVVGLFDDTIARFTALAVLLPVVAGQSGNTGAQALAVTMRGLALREVRARHWLRVAGKEVGAATLNGVAVALLTAGAVFLWSRNLGLTLVIGVSMVISMTLAGLAGALIPMGLTAVGQDPAQSSSIILTTVTDVAGFLSFLGIATALSSLL